MNSLIAVCFVAFLNTAHAFTRCCGPKQWKSEVSQVVGEYNFNTDFYQMSEVATTFYYDFQNSKIAALQTITNETAQPVITHVQQILDFTKMKKWVIQGKTCTKLDLTEDMTSPCIADSATHISNQSLAGEPVDVWFTQYKSGTKVRATVTQKGCVLVTSSTLTGSKENPDFIMTVSVYQNVTAGPIDQSIFAVPDFCQKKKSQIKTVVPSAIPWL